MSGMTLVLSFPDQSESFALGVEFGRIWSQMEQGLDVVSNCNFPVRFKNKKAIELACAHHKYTPFFGEVHYDEWIEFYARKNIYIQN